MNVRDLIDQQEVAIAFGAHSYLNPNFRVQCEVLLEDSEDAALKADFERVADLMDEPVEFDLVDTVTDGHFYCCMSKEEQDEVLKDMREFFGELLEGVRNGDLTMDDLRNKVEIRKVDADQLKDDCMPRIEALRTELSGLLNSGAGDTMIREAYGTCPIEWDYLANKYNIKFDSIQVKEGVKGWTVDLVGTEYNNMHIERYL